MIEKVGLELPPSVLYCVVHVPILFTNEPKPSAYLIRHTSVLINISLGCIVVNGDRTKQREQGNLRYNGGFYLTWATVGGQAPVPALGIDSFHIWDIFKWYGWSQDWATTGGRPYRYTPNRSQRTK